MPERMRLAVCQLECHPAFYRDRLAYLEEPFMPDSYQSSLSYLGTHGIPIAEIQEICKKQYTEWQKERLQSLLSHRLLNEGIPSVIVFPEGSIPVNCLKILYDFASSNKVTVVAGSHTILDTIDAREVYSVFRKDKDLGRGHSYNKDVTFVFTENKIHCQKKQGISPYDRTDMTGLDFHKVTLHPIPVPIGDSKIHLVALVCADALQSPSIKGDFDIVSIISYDQDATHFDNYIGTQIDNGKIAIYCNDGRFGRSRIAFPRDKRPTSWFFGSPLNGRLPEGDALLIIDVPTGELVTQVGVVNPKAQWEVKLLASITYENSTVGDQETSKELREISTISVSQVRSSRLESLLAKHSCNTIQRHKLDHLRELSRKGVDAEQIWQAYGHDLVINDIGLADLEARFAQVCREKLVEHLIDGDLQQKSVGTLQAYLKDCKQRVLDLGKVDIPTPIKPDQIEEAYIDREDEIARMLSFLDRKNESLLEVAVLALKGNSATVSKTLARTGFRRIKRMQVMNTSSAEYIFAEIASTAQDSCILSSADKQSFPELRLALGQWDALWFENCEQLLEGGQWKSAEIEKLINALLNIAQENKVKIIFESAIGLPFNLRDPSVMNRVRIRGFEDDLTKHGVAILDRQLRRVNLSPSDVPIETKNQLVKELGGHPLAIIFCADAIYEEGIGTVMDLVKRGAGFYEEIVSSILKVVALSEEDQQILRALSGCRIEVPRDAVAAACGFPTSEYISNLIRQCLVEVISPATISLPGILRKTFRFNDLNIDTRNSFHKNAAMMYSQMARGRSGLRFAVEAEYHANSIGQTEKTASGLIDGSVAAARKFYEEHNIAKARETLKPLVNEDSPADLLRLSALVDAESGDLESALIKADKVLSRNPSDSYLFYILGKAALTQSKLELADRLVSIGRKAGTAGTRISVLEGRIALRRKDFAVAEAHFHQVITSSRPEPWAYFYLGRTYIRMGSLQKAIDVLYEGDKFLANNPQIRTKAKNAIRTQLGLAYVLNGDLEAASSLLDGLIKQEPDTPEVLYAHWLLTVMRDGVEKASEAFEVFRAAKPKRWEKGYYHLYFGLFMKALDDLPEANEHFALAHKYDPCNVFIMIQYAETLYALSLRSRTENDMKLSKAYANRSARIVRRIFEFDPENPTADDLQIDLYCEFDIQISQLPE